MGPARLGFFLIGEATLAFFGELFGLAGAGLDGTLDSFGARASPDSSSVTSSHTSSVTAEIEMGQQAGLSLF